MKWDGTCCLIQGGILFKRYDRKLSRAAYERKKAGYRGSWTETDFKPAQEGWRACEPEPDEHSGHWPGWLAVSQVAADQWHLEGLANYGEKPPPDGTYEMVGPKIRGNVNRLSRHELWRHGKPLDVTPPVDYDGLKDFLDGFPEEGIVWHHPDGRMVKVKRRDFGFEWPIVARRGVG